MKRGVIVIGANDMNGWDQTELHKFGYIADYDNGIFVEAIPSVYDKLKINLTSVNSEYNKNFIAINELITNCNTECNFNLIDHQIDGINKTYSPSSIYKPHIIAQKFSSTYLGVINTIKLPTIRFSTMIDKYDINMNLYDSLILDVQGAELEVLKSMDHYLDQIDTICTEYSNTEYYKGGVLFKELNKFLVSKSFELSKRLRKEHGNAYYKRRKLATLLSVDADHIPMMPIPLA